MTGDRLFLPFGPEYGISLDIKAGVGVRAGGVLFTCGQVDLDGTGRTLHPGDLSAQTPRAIDLLYGVVARAGLRPADIAHIHVLYRQDGTVDEAEYARAVRALVRDGAKPVVVMTPLGSFPAKGVEAEIDCIAVPGGASTVIATPDGAVAGVEAGPFAFVQATLADDADGDVVAQARELAAQMRRTLAALSLDASHVCALKLTLSAAGAAHPQIVEAERALAALFRTSGPAYTVPVVPRLSRASEHLRVEALAMRATDGRRHLGQDAIWRWPQGLPYAQAVRNGRFVFVGGQLSVGPNGALLHPGDLAAQTHLAMQNHKAALETVGARMADIAKINAFFVGHHDMAAWGLNAGIRSGYYVAPGPAGTGVEVPRLVPAGALISVGSVAVVP